MQKRSSLFYTISRPFSDMTPGRLGTAAGDCQGQACLQEQQMCATIRRGGGGGVNILWKSCVFVLQHIGVGPFHYKLLNRLLPVHCPFHLVIFVFFLFCVHHVTNTPPPPPPPPPPPHPPHSVRSLRTLSCCILTWAHLDMFGTSN